MKREKVSSLNNAFMNTAIAFSLCSKDPVTQVGACIVNKDKRILSVGYNGAPKGFSDDVFPWGKNSPNQLENKYLYVVHAERNAILNFNGSLIDLREATVYVTLFPCNECAKELAQVGISEVIYLHGPKEDDIYEASKTILAHAGIKTTQFVVD